MNTTASSPSLSAQQRRRGLNGLLLYTFFMVIGFAMLMPLVAVHFVNNLGMTAAAVGVALAVRQIVQQGLAFIGGMLSDRFGARLMISLGVLLRAAGFASLAFAHDLPLLVIAMLISALGGALFEAPYQAAIAALATEQERPRYYAMSNWISGVATTLGPLLGIAALHFDFQLVCMLAAACFTLNFVIVQILLPHIDMPEAPPTMRQGISLVLSDRAFMLLIALMSAYWFAAVQINLSFPLLAQQLTSTMDSVGIMFAVVAGLTVLLQYPLVRLLERRLDSAQILVLGIMIMALGMIAIGFAHSFITFLLSVAIFAIGALLTRPTQQTLIARMANPKALGTFLGASSLSLAVGGGLGNIAGGWLFDLSSARHWPLLPWLVFAAFCVVSAIGLLLLTHVRSGNQPDGKPKKVPSYIN